MYFSIEDILDKEQIRERAANKWNSFSPIERLKKSQKYNHLGPFKNSEWVLDFDLLGQSKQNILIKGELIRTYDNMLISDRKKLTNEAHLSKFETKWVKFSPIDKEKLLNYVLEKKSHKINNYDGTNNFRCL